MPANPHAHLPYTLFEEDTACSTGFFAQPHTECVAAEKSFELL